MLNLKPLELEGGYFSETYRSRTRIPADRRGQRPCSTAIYYLLTPDTFSALHRLRSDEVFHFYAGDPVEMLLLRPGGQSEVLVLGNDLARRRRPQVIVPRGVWQGARLARGGQWALLGTTV
ncbi:MAG TPA: cupin domain-containing protein, partial [Candidatus Edwardsbacteria bacterium]|nr:cupin domain-containing protein [Candidatus Edwardsbacteria bacterium]